MRRIIALLLITIAAVPCFAKDAIGDWQAVREDIPRGWGLEVVTSMTFPCVFEHATEEELICTPIQHGRADSDAGEIHLRRDRIREIRVEKREGANVLAAGGAGAGLATILGALVPGGRGVAAYAFGLGGAGFGARSGRDTHILHGKVIYRRAVPDQGSQTKPSSGANTSQKATEAETVSSRLPIVQTLP